MKNTPTILVVDDEQLNRQVILDVLNEMPENFSVLSAINGEIACSIATKMQPDLILMDWNMPKMSGIDAVKFLKNQAETAEIPILMFTSINDPAKLKEAFEEGIADYITKPVKKLELAARVNAALKTSFYQKELIQQKAEIEYQKEEITNSINYAKNIQHAILPKKSKIRESFTDSFVFYEPRDIVSGDFYWYYKKSLPNGKAKLFIAAADCTGHGVPGAFVSMIGNMLFNQIIIEKGIEQPGEILDLMNAGMRNAFTKEDNKLYAKDGMDVSLCCIDSNMKYMEFAGAKNPLYLVRDNVITIFKGDNHAIGGLHMDHHEHFTTHTIDLQQNDALYLFSDGFADQFGGPKCKKYKISRLRSLLLSIQNLSMIEQKDLLLTEINEWKGSLEQVDDMMIIGIKV